MLSLLMRLLNHSHRYSDRPLFNPRLSVIVRALVAIALIVSCAQATIDPTPTTAPTSTPPPTLTPTPVSTNGSSAESLPSPDPEWPDRLTHLLSLIPSNHSPAIFLDVKAALADPDIRQSLDLEVLGLLDTLQPGASKSADSAVVAFRQDGGGMVTVIRGVLDVDGLLTAAGGLGLVSPSPEPERYRGYNVRIVDVFGISLALASVDGSTLVIATGSPTGGTTGTEHLKAALDSSDGLAAGLLDDPETARLVSELPAGVTTVVLGDCANLATLFSLETLRGCTGAAVSADIAESGSGAISAFVSYQDEVQASVAMDLMGHVGVEQDGLSLERIAMLQEGSLLRLGLPADIHQIESVFDALGIP